MYETPKIVVMFWTWATQISPSAVENRTELTFTNLKLKLRTRILTMKTTLSVYEEAVLQAHLASFPTRKQNTDIFPLSMVWFHIYPRLVHDWLLYCVCGTCLTWFHLKKHTQKNRENSLNHFKIWLSGIWMTKPVWWLNTHTWSGPWCCCFCLVSTTLTVYPTWENNVVNYF